MLNQDYLVKRYYYDDGFKKRSACICVRNKEENEVETALQPKFYFLFQILKESYKTLFMSRL